MSWGIVRVVRVVIFQLILFDLRNRQTGRQADRLLGLGFRVRV